MNQLQFNALDSRPLDPQPWDLWIEKAEQVAGHDLDGDDDDDGFSLDAAYEAFERGESPDTFIASIKPIPPPDRL